MIRGYEINMYELQEKACNQCLKDGGDEDCQ